MNGRWKSRVRGSWTAISRAPYLKAITLLAKGDCWNGGGLFTGKDTYWLNDGYGHEVLESSSAVRRPGSTQFPGERSTHARAPEGIATSGRLPSQRISTPSSGVRSSPTFT